MEVRLWLSLQLKGHKKEENFLFFSFLISFDSLLLSLISWHDACLPRGGGRGYKFNKYINTIIIIIIIKGVTPTGSNQRYYIAGRLGEEDRQENTEE